MGKEFIPYQQCLDLKSLGYNEHPLGAYYCKDGSIEYTDDGPNRNSDLDEAPDWCKAHCSAILYQEAFRWFRNKYNLHHFIEFDNNKYDAVVEGHYIHPCDSYEEAEINCLKYLIKLVKNNAH
jgi:hypothetical protein